MRTVLEHVSKATLSHITEPDLTAELQKCVPSFLVVTRCWRSTESGCDIAFGSDDEATPQTRTVWSCAYSTFLTYSLTYCHNTARVAAHALDGLLPGCAKGCIQGMTTV